MATIPCKRAGDSSPLRRPHDFNPLTLSWPVERLPWSPLATATSEEAPAPAIVPGQPVVIRFRTEP